MIYLSSKRKQFNFTSEACIVDRQSAQLARQQGTFVKMSFASQDLPTKHFRDSYLFNDRLAFSLYTIRSKFHAIQAPCYMGQVRL